MHIHTLKLLALDLVAQRHFYANVLQLPVTLTHDTLTVQAGATQLIFQKSTTPVVYHFAFNIPENQLASAKQWLGQRAPLIKKASGDDTYDFPDWNAHAVYFWDATGNILELIARHALPNATAEPFSSRHILNVSEIGLVTDEVVAAAQWLKQQYGLPIYDGGDNPMFAAVGDEHGLFIVVKRGREWQPSSGKFADVFPTEVAFSDHRGERHVWTEALPFA